MSDQTYDAGGPKQIDGSKLINVPAVGGITTINGDATAAQLITVGAGLGILNVGPAHNIFGIPFAPAVPGPTAPGLVPNPGIAGPTDYLAADATFKPIPVIPPAGISQLEDDLGGLTTASIVILEPRVEGAFVPGVFQGSVVAANQFLIDLRNFLGTHGGLVTAPGAAGITDYLGADNTFRPLPFNGFLAGSDPGGVAIAQAPASSVTATVTVIDTKNYIVAGRCTAAFNAQAIVGIAVNGTLVLTAQYPVPVTVTGFPTQVTISGILALNATDVVTLVVSQDAGATTSIADTQALSVVAFI
jgi:hypothetical protein